MKQIFCLFLFLTPAVLYCQQQINLPLTKDSTIVYQQVIESTFSKDLLFLSAKEWIIDYYDTPSNVVVEENKDEGLLIIKGTIKDIFPFNRVGENTFHTYETDFEQFYTLRIDIKDSRYRYIITLNNIKIFVTTSTPFGDVENWVDKSSKDFIRNYFNDSTNYKMKVEKANKIHEEIIRLIQGLNDRLKTRPTISDF